MIFWLFLAALTLFKIVVASYFPLIGDEAYYWLWSKHLALSYVDHPPMIAYVNFIITALFGNSELAIRLAAIAIVLLISIIIYLTGKELFNEQAGRLAAVIFNLLPIFFAGGLFLVPQTVLFFFWSLSFYLLVKITRQPSTGLWLLLGVSVGLGMLSDYIMPFFIVGTLLFLLFSKEHRFWLQRKEPYLCLGLILLLFLPVIIWNLTTSLASPAFVAKRFALANVGDKLLNFFGLQMLLFTPPIFIMTLFFWKPRHSVAGFQHLLSIFSAVVFLPFALISPVVSVGGHWLSTAYLPAILNSHRAKKITVGTILFFSVLVNALGFTYYLFLYPTPEEMKGRELTINAKLPAYLKEVAPKTGRTYYFGNDLGILSLVSFYGKVTTYSAPGRIRQVDLWGKPELKQGDNIIYFAINETSLYEKLKMIFRRVSIEPHKRLFNKDADLPNLTQIFICEGYKGGIIP